MSRNVVNRNSQDEEYFKDTGFKHKYSREIHNNPDNNGRKVRENTGTKYMQTKELNKIIKRMYVNEITN